MFLFPDYLCFDSRLIAHETTIAMPYATLAQASRCAAGMCACVCSGVYQARASYCQTFIISPANMQHANPKLGVLSDVQQVTKHKTLGIPNALEIRIRGHGDGAGLKLYACCLLTCLYFPPLFLASISRSIARRNA